MSIVPDSDIGRVSCPTISFRRWNRGDGAYPEYKLTSPAINRKVNIGLARNVEGGCHTALTIESLNAISLLLAKISFAITLLTTPSSSVLQTFVKAESLVYHVNPELSACLVQHESLWRPNNKGPEPNGSISRGLWQINQSWKDVADIQAYDPVFSTTWALTKISEGHVKYWSTFNLYCSSTPVFEQ